MQAIIYKHGEGVAIIYPAEGADIKAIIKQSVPPGASKLIVDPSSFPDPYFRDAWGFHSKKGITVNIAEAKEIQKSLWRRMRKGKLAALDVLFMQALETSDKNKISSIAAQKKALRDVTKTPLPDNLEGIKNAIPEILI